MSKLYLRLNIHLCQDKDARGNIDAMRQERQETVWTLMHASVRWARRVDMYEDWMLNELQ